MVTSLLYTFIGKVLSKKLIDEEESELRKRLAFAACVLGLMSIGSIALGKFIFTPQVLDRIRELASLDNATMFVNLEKVIILDILLSFFTNIGIMIYLFVKAGLVWYKNKKYGEKEEDIW